MGTTQRMEKLEKYPHDFGSGVLLNFAEIHTIAAIGHHPDINITNLAEHHKISKSAISQMIRKLSEKKLVEKYRDPGNDKEVLLRLTPRGKIAYLGHEHFHAKFDEKMQQNLGDMGVEDFEKVRKFFIAVEKTVDSLTQELK
jgi:DNA-binding MarR family transcriptional regulator